MGNTDKHTHLLWRAALLAWFFGGVGGILVDTDHILSAATQGKIPWAFLHQPVTVIVLIGCVIASCCGLLTALVLRK